MAIEDIAGVSNVTISTTGALTVHTLSGSSAVAVSTTASLNVARKIAGSSAIVIRAGGTTGASLSGGVGSIECWQPYNIVIDRYLYGGLNNFASEPAPTRAVALYRCESGGLLQETLQTNHLSQDISPAPSPISGTPREGVSSVYWAKTVVSGDASESGYRWRRTNVNLTADFPGQSGSSSQAYAVCGWLYVNWSTWSADPGNDWINGWFQKSTHYGITWSDNGNPGPNGSYSILAGLGGSQLSIAGGNRISNGRWYHIGISAQSIAGAASWIIRIWDNTALTMHFSTTGAGSFSFSHGAAQLEMFASIASGSGNWAHQDAWDEVVWFNRALSAAEIDLIRTGNYYF